MVNSALITQQSVPEPQQLWSWLHEVPDPEIPVISVVDLGIVRDVQATVVDGDWMSELGKSQLKSYGIAPPAQQVIDISGISRKRLLAPKVACPHCNSMNTICISQFGSTSCKSLYRCKDCLEPFDYFKAH